MTKSLSRLGALGLTSLIAAMAIAGAADAAQRKGRAAAASAAPAAAPAGASAQTGTLPCSVAPQGVIVQNTQLARQLGARVNQLAEVEPLAVQYKSEKDWLDQHNPGGTSPTKATTPADIQAWQQRAEAYNRNIAPLAERTNATLGGFLSALLEDQGFQQLYGGVLTQTASAHRCGILLQGAIAINPQFEISGEFLGRLNAALSQQTAITNAINQIKLAPAGVAGAAGANPTSVAPRPLAPAPASPVKK